jgi:hypothetical protein
MPTYVYLKMSGLLQLICSFESETAALLLYQQGLQQHCCYTISIGGLNLKIYSSQQDIQVCCHFLFHSHIQSVILEQ